MRTGFGWRDLGEDHLGDPGLGGRIILKWILKSWDSGMGLIDLTVNFLLVACIKYKHMLTYNFVFDLLLTGGGS